MTSVRQILGAASRFKSDAGIRIAKASVSRGVRDTEAMSLVTDALGTLNQHGPGVWTINLSIDGKPLAMAVVPNACFEETTQATRLLPLER